MELPAMPAIVTAQAIHFLKIFIRNLLLISTKKSGAEYLSRL